MISSFKTIPETELRAIIQWYHTKNDTVWEDVLTNLDIEPKYLEPNKILGLYWDSKVEETYSYLYLIWTSEYIPSEFINIKEIVVNHKTYKLYDSEHDKQELNANWWLSDYYHFAGYNLTIHKTPIGGYEQGKTFGIPLTQKYHFKGFKTGIDEAEYINN